MKKIKSTVLLFLTAIIWGFAFVAQRVGADYVGTFTFNGIRFLLGGLSLIPVILLFEKEKYNKEKLEKTLLSSICCGLILFIASTLQQYGVLLTQSAGKSGFLTGIYTVLVPIFSFVFLHKKTSFFTWIGATFAVIGLYLLSVTRYSPIGTGDIILLIGAIFWALHILIIDYFISSISPIKFASLQFLVCGFLSLVCAFIFEDIHTADIYFAVIPILYGGIMSVGVAYTCQILGQKDADPTFAAIVFSTESVFSAIGGAIILHEFMTFRGYIGCLFIFSGIIISQLKTKLQKVSDD